MTVEEARVEAVKYGPEKAVIRSCWHCNKAHDHLKYVALMNCFVCGHWYYKGLDITEEEK